MGNGIITIVGYRRIGQDNEVIVHPGFVFVKPSLGQILLAGVIQFLQARRFCLFFQRYIYQNSFQDAGLCGCQTDGVVFPIIII